MYPKNLFFSLLFFALSCAQPNSAIQKSVDSFKNSGILRHAQWGLYAEYVDSGEPLLHLNADKSLAPASGLKLFTSAAALEILGLDFQFETRLYHNGSIDKNGTLNGDIIIRGGGDPTLGSDRIEGTLLLDDLMQSWTEAVKKSGIKIITGSILADATLFDDMPVPGNWVWIDMGNYYGAGVNALSIHDNLYHLYFKPGKRAGLPAKVLRTEPLLSNLLFDNQMLTGAKGSGDNGYIFRAPNSNTATLRGTIPAGVQEFSIKGSLPDPALFSAIYFKKNLQKNGLTVSDNCGKIETETHYKELHLLHTTRSPQLVDIVEVLNKRSVNHYAEQLLFMLSVDSLGIGKRKIGIERIEHFLKQNQIDISPLNLEDGSGLSPNNLISAKMMVQLLKIMYSKKSFKPFYRSLALAGDSQDMGFFKKFGRNTIIEKKCRIKSGLIQGVRSHSGYLTTASGRLVAFSFIANNFTELYSKIDNIHKKLLIQLAQNY